MKTKMMIMFTAAMMVVSSCRNDQGNADMEDDFRYSVDRFADLEILRYQVPGFEELSLQKKQLLYHLSEAALMGRDIMFDQNNRYNLAIRRSLELIYSDYDGDRNNDQFKALEAYLKRVWFSNGIHHHYSTDKFLPDFTPEFFETCVRNVDPSKLPVREGQSVDQWLDEIKPVIFDKEIMNKRVMQSGEGDLIARSANNYYGENVTLAEVESFYSAMKDPNDDTPISYGLNSRLVKEENKLKELVWKVDGLYTQAIEKIIVELEKSIQYTENDAQKAVIEKLIDYYTTGDLVTFDEYAILWVEDLNSDVDFINGFTETYGDPLGMKASWESVVNFINTEATKRTKIISDNAQWFEDNSPTDPRFKKESVKGVTAKVITVTMLGGDCYPATPIGINLPNSNWIRAEHGSKSVTIENITEAYDKASQGSGFGPEFYWSDIERDLVKKYSFSTDNLHTDLHECLGHGSGKLLPGVDPDGLKAYSATLEEARADLFALYYLGDDKMLELGLLSDKEAYKSEYYTYMMNGLMSQLVRVELGRQIEESHMRNRQLIAKWVYEKGMEDNVVEYRKKDGKTYVVVNDYVKLRELFGELLKEVQRIKSEGDYAAGRDLVENYAIQVDPVLHKEVLERYATLNLAPYKGFINPVMKEVRDSNGTVTDVVIDYSEGYTEQMLRYSNDYSYLPTYN